jgi:fructokinase
MAVVCLGEALVDFVADVPDVSLAECPGFRKAAGGGVANAAVALARLGVPTAFLGKVGDDPFGRFLAETMAASGVDTRFLRFDATARTGLAFVSLRADGERAFVFFRNPSADMLHRADEVPDEALAGCRWFHHGSISLIQEPSRGATLETLRRVKAAGGLISFDPNLRPALWPNPDAAREQILAALPLADLAKLSAEEAEFLFGPAEADEQAARVLGLGPSLAAITLGAQGSLLANARGTAREAAPTVAAVDATGAGDAYAGALIAGLLERGAPGDLDAGQLAGLARFANAAGALTTTRKGGIPALPTREAVLELARHPSASAP